MLTICNPLFLLNVTSHLIPTATVEERSYDHYLQKTEELSHRIQNAQLWLLSPACPTELPLDLHFNFQAFSSLSFS